MKSPFFTEEHDVFRESVRQFIHAEILPGLEEWEREERIPREIWRRMGENYLLGINHPEAHGGCNADFFYSIAFLEELASSSLGFTAAVCTHQFRALTLISHYGSNSLKELYLAPGILGEKIAAAAIIEPDSGSDINALQTKAEKQGGNYLINGIKTFIINGVYSDFIVLAARTAPEHAENNISLFVIDSNSPGIEIRKCEKIGWFCSDIAELSFNNVNVPAMCLIGEENMGGRYLSENNLLERLTAAASAAASANSCLEVTRDYILQRQVFERPLADFQVIRHTLSDLAAQAEAARQLVYFAAWRYSAGLEALKHAAMAKLYAGELLKKTADQCLQYFGGYGYIKTSPIARMYRDSRAATIVFGSSEMMRQTISDSWMDHPDSQFETVYQANPAQEETLPEDNPAETVPEDARDEAEKEAYPEPEIHSEYDDEELTPDEETAASEADVEGGDETPIEEPVETDEAVSFAPETLPVVSENAVIEEVEQTDKNAGDTNKNIPYSEEIYEDEPGLSEEVDIADNYQTDEAPKTVFEPSAASPDRRGVVAEETPSPEIESDPDETFLGSPISLLLGNAPEEVIKVMENAFQQELKRQEAENQNKKQAAEQNRPVTPQIETSTPQIFKSGIPQKEEKKEAGMSPGKGNGNMENRDEFPAPAPPYLRDKKGTADLSREKKPQPGQSRSAQPEAKTFNPPQRARVESAVKESAVIPTIETIAKSLPGRFKAKEAANMNAVFHFKITGGGDGDYTVVIRPGECRVGKGLSGKPDCLIETNARTHFDLETGKTNAQIAFMMGKVKASNVQLMIKFYKLFNDLPET